MPGQDPASDVLTIAGEVIPPSGQLGSTRYMFEFPASMVFGSGMNGRLIKISTRATSAKLAVSVLEDDPANDIFWRLSNEQDRAGASKAVWPGSGVIMRGPQVGRAVVWSDTSIEQRATISSDGSVVVKTWTFQIENVVVT